MSDLFSRLARRTLEPSPRLAVRLPSRFEPAGGVISDRGAELQRAPASGAAPPPVRWRSGSARSSEGPEGLLPPSRSAGSAGAAIAASDRSTPEAAAPEIDRRAPLADHGHPELSVSPADAAEPAMRQRSAAARPLGRDRSDPAAVHDERRSAFAGDSGAHLVKSEGSRAPEAPATPAIAPSTPVEVTLDELERRLRPLLPPQPPLRRPATAAATVDGVERVVAREETSSAPPVEISIGSVEVRAVLPEAPSQPARHGPTLTLDEYLRSRDRGGR